MLKTKGNYKNCIILFNPNWHLGIIGIVASKIMETFYKPVFMMTYSEETKQIRCSARSVEEVPVYDMISNISEYLDGFGGHSMAGGFAFSVEKTTLEDVSEALSKTIHEFLGEKKLTPSLKIDLEVEPEEIDIHLVNELEKLEPFGASNPPPVFAMKNMQIKQKKLIGGNKDHLKLTIQHGEKVFDCLRWSQGDVALNIGDYLDIAFTPQINEFNGNISIQLIIKDIHSELLKEMEAPAIKIYDHRKKTNILKMVEDYVKDSKHKFCVFAEDKTIIELLKPYPHLSSKIVSRLNIEPCEGLMFFDYPCDEKTYNDILEKSEASVIHYMKYDFFKFDITKMLKTFNGLVKYVINNKNGDFNIKGCAAFLSISEEIVRTTLELFAETDAISVDRIEEDICTVTAQNLNCDNFTNSTKYKELTTQVSKMENFRREMMKKEL